MKPIRFAELVPIIAERLGKPEYMVDSVLKQYWKAIRTALSSLEHSRIQVYNVGTFMVKPTCLNRRLILKQKLLDRPSKNYPKGRFIKEEIQREVSELAGLQQLLKSETERKELIKEKKRRYNDEHILYLETTK